MHKSNLSSLRLTERDRNILADLTLANCAGIDELVSLGLFNGVSRARRRLAALCAAGYVRRSFLAEGSSSARGIFMIGPEAVDCAVRATGLDHSDVVWRARRPFARTFAEHSLMVLAIRKVLTTSEAAQFVAEPLLRHEYQLHVGGKQVKSCFKPDGMFTVGACETRVNLFLEACRGFTSIAKFLKTAEGYARYVRLGLYGQEYGEAAVATLVVTTGGDRRISHLRRATEKISSPRFFFATYDSVLEAPESAIWKCSRSDDPFSLAELVEGVLK